MTFGGWIIMTVSVTSVTALLVWCIYKVLVTPGESEHMHGFEMKTPDEREDGEN